jgi:hypothetical protein
VPGGTTAVSEHRGGGGGGVRWLCVRRAMPLRCAAPVRRRCPQMQRFRVRNGTQAGSLQYSRWQLPTHLMSTLCHRGIPLAQPVLRASRLSLSPPLNTQIRCSCDQCRPPAHPAPAWRHLHRWGRDGGRDPRTNRRRCGGDGNARVIKPRGSVVERHGAIVLRRHWVSESRASGVGWGGVSVQRGSQATPSLLARPACDSKLLPPTAAFSCPRPDTLHRRQDGPRRTNDVGLDGAGCERSGEGPGVDRGAHSPPTPPVAS